MNNKNRGILLLVFLSIFFGEKIPLAQELDDKVHLLEEPMISPNEEIPTLPEEFTKSIEKQGIVHLTPSGTPTVELKEERIFLPSQVSTETITSTKTAEEKTTLLSTPTTPSGTTTVGINIPKTPPQIPEEGTVTFPSGTLTTSPLSAGTLTIGTTTIDVGTPTSKKPDEITLLNTGLILVPTAYRRDNKIGFNTDFIITYYIGELWHRMKKDSSFFTPIKFLFLSGDFKFSLVKEKKRLPHFGTGYEWFLVLKGEAPTSGQMGGKFSGKSDRFGYPYFIFSKEFKHLKCHLGMMSGELGKLFNPLSNFAALENKKAIIFALDTKLFNRKINIEGISPVGSKFNLLINTSIERFLGFDVSFMKIPAGYSIIGYFGVRLTIFPYIKDKK